jgi:hypothetical protein
MRQEAADRLATGVLVAGSLVGAWFVWHNPRLRRLAWDLTRYGVVTALPAYLSREVREAWRNSATSRTAAAG